MSNIVKITEGFEADLDKPFPVNARNLWSKLESRDAFIHWVKDQIKRAHLVEKTDYLIYGEKPINSGRGRARHEYYFTTNAAKHVALMSNTQNGKEIRQRLIDIEVQYLGVLNDAENEPREIGAETSAVKLLQARLLACNLLTVPAHLAQIESCKYTRLKTGIDFSPLLQLSAAQENIAEQELMLEPTECAKRLNFTSATAFNRALEAQGLQNKIGSSWEPIGEAIKHSSKHAWVRGNKSGYNLKWRISFLNRVFNIS